MQSFAWVSNGQDRAIVSCATISQWVSNNLTGYLRAWTRVGKAAQRIGKKVERRYFLDCNLEHPIQYNINFGAPSLLTVCRHLQVRKEIVGVSLA